MLTYSWSQDQALSVNHKHAYLLEVFGDSLRLEMPCLLAIYSDKSQAPGSWSVLWDDVGYHSAKKQTTTEMWVKCYGFSDTKNCHQTDKLIQLCSLQLGKVTSGIEK